MTSPTQDLPQDVATTTRDGRREAVPAIPAPGPIETIHVDSPVLACDGGGGPLGHPRVWLRIVEKQTFCPYCSRLYVLAPGAETNHGH